MTPKQSVAEVIRRALKARGRATVREITGDVERLISSAVLAAHSRQPAVIRKYRGKKPSWQATIIEYTRKTLRNLAKRDRRVVRTAPGVYLWEE